MNEQDEVKLDKEFQDMKRNAIGIEPSPYAKFHMTHSGYRFFRRGVECDKWEVFNNDLRYYERVEK